MTTKVSMLERFLSSRSARCHSHWDRLHSKSLSTCSSLLRRRPVGDIAVLTTPFPLEVDRPFDEDERRPRFSRRRWMSRSRREGRLCLPLWDVCRVCLDRVDFDRIDEWDDRFDGVSKDREGVDEKIGMNESNFLVVVLNWRIDLRVLFEIAGVEHLSKIRFHRSERKIDWLIFSASSYLNSFCICSRNNRSSRSFLSCNSFRKVSIDNRCSSRIWSFSSSVDLNVKHRERRSVRDEEKVYCWIRWRNGTSSTSREWPGLFLLFSDVFLFSLMKREMRWEERRDWNLPFLNDTSFVDVIEGMIPRRLSRLEIEIIQFSLFVLTRFPSVWQSLKNSFSR